MIGAKVGRWEVLAEAPRRGYRKVYLCRCECGTEREVYAQNLTRKKPSSSCGCLSRDLNFVGHKDILGTYWGRLQADAKRRGIGFGVSIEYAWREYEKQGGCCALTGIPIDFAKSAKELWDCKNTASLDRIDSALPYVEGNIQWVHKDVNRMKQDFQEAYFFDLCRRVCEYAGNTIR